MGFLKAASLPCVVAPTAALLFSTKLHNKNSWNPHPNSRNTTNKHKPIISIKNKLIQRFSFPIAHCSTKSMASSTHLDSSTFKSNGDTLPDVMTEFMVEMHCGGCVSAVKEKLEALHGVKKVDADLDNQVVRVLGSTSISDMSSALEQAGRKARLIGQGLPEEFLMSAAVAEFKGSQILGVVRFAQVNMELCRVEANFSGLAPGIHSWSINEFGDLTNGAASTGKIYSPSPSDNSTEPLGDLGKLIADEHGNANFKGVKHMLRVGDLIGRAVVLYEGEDVSGPRTVAAVIARSAGVGENYKKVCSCDGTIIWESSNSDFVKG